MSQKRPRRSRAELRALMLAGGKHVLLQTEPRLGFEQLTYSAVFSHLQSEYDQRVTIGSVHERIWKSQRDFQLDVIAEALGDTLPVQADDALERAGNVIATADLSTPAARRYALQSAIRLSSASLSTLAHPQATRLAHTVRFGLWALGPDSPESAGFTDAITRIREASTQEYTHVVRMIMEYIGLRVRPQAGDPDEAITAIAILGNALQVGLQTDVIEEAHRIRELPSGPNGELEEWFPDSIGLWAHVQSTFELDGDDLSEDDRRL